MPIQFKRVAPLTDFVLSICRTFVSRTPPSGELLAVSRFAIMRMALINPVGQLSLNFSLHYMYDDRYAIC